MVRDKIKDRQNSVRIYDEEGYLQRAAAICIREEGKEEEILLVSSSSQSGQWVVPGGGVEPAESHTVAAMREVVEEAGVKGHIDRCLGIFQNDERRTRTVVYVMIVTEELSEWDDSKNIGRKRKWFSIEEAFQKLAQHKPIQVDYLQQLRIKHKRDVETATTPET